MPTVPPAPNAPGPGPGAVHPVDVADLRVRVNAVIEGFLARQAAVLAEVSPRCAPLADYVADLMGSGKRLRAAFCYWGWRGAGGQDRPEIVTAAAALEFFQAAALIHDDVMDGSDTRRGMPSVHRRFADLHHRSRWDADGELFGVAGAVLAGDLCLVWSDELLTGCGLGPGALSGGRPHFDRMRTELMGGQYLDILAQVAAGRDGEEPGADAVERARRVIRYKSAKYSVEQPLLLGGGLAGAPEELLATYSGYGLPLGEAFQLRDDVLGVFGDPAVTGKPAGDDLREGKRTVLVAETLRAASPAQARLVERLLGRPGLDGEGITALREVIVETGALDAVEKLVDELADRALAALTAAAVPEPARGVLTDLVTATTARSV